MGGISTDERERKEEKREERGERREEREEGRVGLTCHVDVTSIFNNYFNTV